MASLESRVAALEAALGCIRKVVVCCPGAEPPADANLFVIRVRYVRATPREKRHES
jgi:hypothetical protein